MQIKKKMTHVLDFLGSGTVNNTELVEYVKLCYQQVIISAIHCDFTACVSQVDHIMNTLSSHGYHQSLNYGFNHVLPQFLDHCDTDSPTLVALKDNIAKNLSEGKFILADQKYQIYLDYIKK